MKKTLEIPKIRIAHISKFLGGGGAFEGFLRAKNTKLSFLPLGLKAQRGITIMMAGGRPAGRACAMSVVSHFFVQFFSYDPEISHACSPP